MTINNRTLRPLFLVSALCLALMWLSDCARTAGGAGRAAEPGFLANDQILRVYWTYGKSRSPLTEKALVGEDSVWKACSYDSLNYHIETKKGNDGKKVNVGLHAGRIKYELFGVISGNEVVFERPLKEYTLTVSELIQMDVPETTCAPAEESEPTVPIAYDEFTDKRDGQTYRTAKMPDGKTWTARNLNYPADSSWCNKNADSNCVKYGRLYNWNAAMMACPAGYHLPSREEWEDLVKAAGGEWYIDEVFGTGNWSGSGGKLKSTSGWKNGFKGSDKFGFSALPGGSRDCDGNYEIVVFPGGPPDSSSGGTGYGGSWWTATADSGGMAYYRSMYYIFDDVGEFSRDKNSGHSVRCVRD